MAIAAPRRRALVVFDEVYGMLPPHPANPRSKHPTVALMKQGRAFGIGVLVATPNPMDLDYRALSNAGRWAVGRLQTDAERARVVESLAVLAERRLVAGDTAEREFTAEHIFAELISKWALSGECVRSATPTAGFRAMAEQLGVSCSRLLYEGNERKDIDGARAAGCRTALLWRLATEPPAWDQASTIHSLEQLLKLDYDVP